MTRPANFSTSLLRKPSEFTFQTIDDDKDRSNPKLAQIFHGSLDEHLPELRRLSRLGAGVFVKMNTTDGKGAKTENIIGVRAVSLDLDGTPLDPVDNARSSRI